MKIHAYGDGGIYIDLEMDDAPDRAVRTRTVAASLRHRLPDADVVIGAGSLAVFGVGGWDDLDSVVLDAMHEPEGAHVEPRTYELQAIYDGPDLEEVARLTGHSVAEVVALHSEREYTVELIGFLPGFAYLAPLDPRLVVARRASPRPRVPPASLAIAGSYTGIYPLGSPGGWQLIGRVFGVALFDPQRDPPALLQPGDRVRFVRCDA